MRTVQYSAGTRREVRWRHEASIQEAVFVRVTGVLHTAGCAWKHGGIVLLPLNLCTIRTVFNVW